MFIHTMWIGTEIPIRYHGNVDRFRSLNSGFQHMHWEENDVMNLLRDYGFLDLYRSMPSFITKFNLAKYTLLDKFGGVFTDLDILWKRSFTEIMNDQGFNEVDIILTRPADTKHYYINNQLVYLLDDPFIITRPNLFRACINFRSRRNLRIDPKTGVTHKAEPIGPFLLTEWLHANPIRVRSFSQPEFLSSIGHYGYHEQMDLWNK